MWKTLRQFRRINFYPFKLPLRSRSFCLSTLYPLVLLSSLPFSLKRTGDSPASPPKWHLPESLPASTLVNPVISVQTASYSNPQPFWDARGRSPAPRPDPAAPTKFSPRRVLHIGPAFPASLLPGLHWPPSPPWPCPTTVHCHTVVRVIFSEPKAGHVPSPFQIKGFRL